VPECTTRVKSRQTQLGTSNDRLSTISNPTGRRGMNPELIIAEVLETVEDCLIYENYLAS
jgi:hypothetical protein